MREESEGLGLGPGCRGALRQIKTWYDRFKGLEDGPAGAPRRLGGRLTAPTIVAGKVFVAQIDRHTLDGLDARAGRVLWRLAAGAVICLAGSPDAKPSTPAK